jgi:NhaP-type Na+/H+ or K+/H+ antiporter
VFVLAGVIITHRGKEFITFEHLLKNAALYVILHVIRFIGILILTPWMNLYNYKIDFAQIVFASYAGMRGAVALSLALLLT